MNGPEHYAEAERLLTLSGDLPPNAAREIGAITVAQAQVHATLALAAATADSRHLFGNPEIGAETYLGASEAWREAIA